MTERPNVTLLIQQLRAPLFFGEVEDAVLVELAGEAVWCTYAAGEVVFLEGEVAPGLYVLHTGWLKAVKVSPEGREQTLRFIGPGETFNEISVFADRPNPATAIALEPAGLWLLPRTAILRLLSERPEVARHIIGSLADRVVDLVNLVTDLSLRPVTGRLARLLLEGASGDVLHRPRWYTQAELAARLGTVSDVVQRAMRGLEAEGVIDVERHLIRIRDRAALERLAG
jgi:CRP/FNR family transcriptional regulator